MFKNIITLFFFIIGSVAGTYHFTFWSSLPSLGGISLLDNYTLAETLTFQLGLIAALYLTVFILDKKKNKIISSSLIRKIINKGGVKEVEKLLGRAWCVEGKVIKGAQRGRKIGFPTCNIKLDPYTIPKLGVYSVHVQINNTKKRGVANIGYRPTFNGKNLLLEVNIFGIKRNLYKKNE